MIKKTNLKEIQNVAISFLYTDIKENEYSPMIVDHPIFTSAIQYDEETGLTVNILEDIAMLKKFHQIIKRQIKDTKSVKEIMYIIRPPYYLAFLKYSKPYLCQKNFSELLAFAWVRTENPNQDANVSIKTLIKWFQKSDKTFLMNKEEYEIYNHLPENFTVYRGVAVGREPFGLSWTDNYEKALWFSNRFNTASEKGYVYTATINKENILAYFEQENEIVVDPKTLNDIHII
jgi:hypothetical protein